MGNSFIKWCEECKARILTTRQIEENKPCQICQDGKKHAEREVGSIGGGGRDGGRVAKGKRMAGRMGGDRITSKGLKVVSVKPDTNEIFIQGTIAGRRGTLVEVLG